MKIEAVPSNFGDTYGFSARGIAMGNAITAGVNDWSSVFYNMAGLGRTWSDDITTTMARWRNELGSR